MTLAALLGLDPAFFLVTAAIVGLCLGSFVNVVIHRLPGMIDPALATADDDDAVPNLFSPPSRCPHCQSPIRARDNIPVVSYLLLRGRCAHCAGTIPLRYPLVEIIGGVLGLFIAATAATPLTMLGALVFSFALLALVCIDLEHYLLPDAITLPLLWAGLLVNLDGTFTDLSSAVIGAAAGYLVLWAVFHLFRLLTGKEGLGYGDFKLVAAIGAWLGWQMLPLVVLLASVAGALIGGLYLAVSHRGRDHPIPFGPFLAASGWIAMLQGERILDAYLQFAGLG